MSTTLIQLAYLVAAILFILGLRNLSSPKTASRGNSMAAVGMLIAIVSLLSGRRVKEGIAITGEITLRGRVLPIGGVKEKLTAAHRAGLKQVILPFENKRDMEDVPDKVKNDLKITFVKRMNQILDIALESEPTIPPVTGPPEVSEDGASKERRRPVVDDEVFTEDVVAN